MAPSAQQYATRLERAADQKASLDAQAGFVGSERRHQALGRCTSGSDGGRLRRRSTLLGGALRSGEEVGEGAERDRGPELVVHLRVRVRVRVRVRARVRARARARARVRVRGRGRVRVRASPN